MQDSEEELQRLQAAQGAAVAESNQLRAGLQAATARLKVSICGFIDLPEVLLSMKAPLSGPFQTLCFWHEARDTLLPFKHQ